MLKSVIVACRVAGSWSYNHKPAVMSLYVGVSMTVDIPPDVH